MTRSQRVALAQYGFAGAGSLSVPVTFSPFLHPHICYEAMDDLDMVWPVTPVERDAQPHRGTPCS